MQYILMERTRCSVNTAAPASRIESDEFTACRLFFSLLLLNASDSSMSDKTSE